ncbi:hypothetical protein NDR89_23110 [Cupriavidus gilardii]|uniref:Uncharacterized protein n=1 Tax=Cupriavidus gilardii TaxID=82541 RepID=A0ABY4VQM3_9BURK|nr:hypothetical protein [Cupriavidus gilardii]USE79483.1 hypothetical protein NDR89_23110 [Cupriavidus gilardii]
MSILDYDDLKGKVGQWLKRTDLADVSGDFVMLFEARFNRNVRVRQMESSYSQAISDKTVALPDDWLEMIGKPTLNGKLQSFITRDQYKALDRSIPVYEDGYFSIFGSNLKLAADVSEGPTLEFDYYAKLPSLSVANPTNWLLADGPDIYLYGSLLEAEPYLKNDPRIETWRALLQVAMTDMQDASDVAKHSGGTLEIRQPC